jgi:sigma-54 dependent transcriptional regulator, acetoin dehydrogenase operon transcriptional activator AcoR
VCLLDNGVSSNEREYVARSHERCRIMGVSKDLIYSKKIIQGEELREKLEQNEGLIVMVMPFMNELYNFVKGSNFFAILTDKEGCILSMIGDEKILSEAYSLKMIPGAYMDESNIGSNAMGTALAEEMPVQISAKDHYITAFHRWTCSGSPIRDVEGNIIGSLDLTGYCEAVHSHTLGMVVAATSAISKMMEANAHAREANIARFNMETVINSIDAGILTSDMDGNIKSVNKHIENMFGYNENEMKRNKIYDLFEGWDKVKDGLLRGKAFFDEDVYINARKNKLQYNLSAYPVYYKDNTIVKIVYVFKDIKRIRKLASKIMAGQAVYSFDKIIGNNERFLKIKEYVKKVSDSRSTILIMGESGTGKEVFAQSIHNYSNRKEESFIAVNCGAIPRNLIESELFGYEEGAFTGARKGGYAGKFEIADGGTIFLDEIGEMPLDMQTKLLRVIEEGVITRIGAIRQIPVNVRIIAATNKDLSQETEKGNFRKDLYYRLNVLPVYLPSLRERRDDIPLLINYFMKILSKRLNKRMIDIPDEYMESLVNYNWPGNIRELENIIELIINTESLPDRIIKEGPANEMIIQRLDKQFYKLEHIEKLHISMVLKEMQGNISLASKALGIGRNTLYRKLEKYDIDCSNIEQCDEMEQ